MSRKLGLGAALLALIAGGVVWKTCGSGGDSKSASQAKRTRETAKVVKRRSAVKDARTQARASVAGVVKAKAGGPIAGAKVCAWATGGDLAQADRAEPRCVSTDDNGAYVIDKLLASEYWLGASAAKYRPARFKKNRRWRKGDVKLTPGQRMDDVDFVLEPGGVRVTGVVKDIGGGVVSDAFIYASGGVARSDAQGKFTMWLKRGSRWLSGSAEGYSSSWTRVHAPTETAELLLTPESILEGKVVLATTGEPVANASVSAETRKVTRTDANGNFRVVRLDPGRYKPSATSDGLYGESAESVLLGMGETRSGLVIKLHPMGIIRGRVVIGDTDKPCAEPSVSLKNHMDRRWGGSYGKDVGDGWVEFGALAKGEYKVDVSCRGYAAANKYPDVKATGKDITDIVWKVTSGSTIRGVVKTFDGKPAVGVRVRAWPEKRMDYRWNANRSDTTDDDGKFALQGLSPGAFSISVRTSEHVAPKDNKLSVKVADGETKDIELTLRQGGRVKGVVVDKKGAPQAGFTVWVSRSRWGTSEASTAADGTFELEGVAAGKQTIAAKRGRRGFRFRRGNKHPSAETTVVAGDTAEVKIVVDVHEGVITGKVVDPSGKPVTDAFVRAVLETGKTGYQSATARARRTWGEHPVAAQADGTFEVKDLAPGKYLVRAYRKGGGEAFKKQVEVGADVTLTIEKTVTVSGAVTTADGEPVERFKISVAEQDTGLKRDESFFATGGNWKISGLPAGDYQISVTASEGEGSQKHKLKAGDSKDGIDFQLEGLAKLEGYAKVVGSGDAAVGMRVIATPVDGNLQDSWRRSFMQRVTTDDKGYFKLPSVAPGKVMVMLWSMGGDYSGGVSMVEVSAGQTASVKVPVVPKYVKKGEENGSLGFEVNAPKRSMIKTIKPFDVTVKSVEANGAGAAAGLKVGDVITEVEGVDVTGYNSARWTFFGASVRKGQTMTYKLRSGSTVKVTAR